MDKKVTYETIREAMNDHCPQVEILDWHGVEITVQKIVPFLTMKEIVEDVAGACFNDDTGEYMPELMDIALRICVIDAYTNIVLPGDPEEQNRILYGTGLWSGVSELIDEDQFNAIELAVSRRVKARLDVNRAEFEHELNAMTNALSEAGKQINDLFAGVNADDLQKLVAALGEHGVDEEKIVQAVVAEQNKLREEQAEAPADGE